MAITKLKELENYKSKVAALEKEIATERTARFSSLHKEVGLESTEALIAALKGLSKKASKRSKRARLNPAIKQKIANAIKAGLKGVDAAKKFSVSIPTIQNIKNEFELVKSRKVKKPKKRVAKKVATKAAKKVAKKATKKATKKVAKKVAKKAAKKKAKK